MRFIDEFNNQCYIFAPARHSAHDSVIVVGRQVIHNNDKYPLEGFPEAALFSDSGGRCIDNFQLLFISEGRGIFRDRGISYEVGPGSMFLIKPGVWHSYAPDPKTGWTEYYVGFEGEVFSRVIKDGFPQTGGVRIIDSCADIISIFEKMLSYSRSEPEDVEFLLKSILMLLISEIVFSSNLMSQSADHRQELLSKARDYMEENISGKINLSELAIKLGASYSTFKNVFNELTGLSPNLFLKQMRLRKAKYLLGTTKKLIKSIGLECGFGTAEYFCNCFRDETGLTPQEFREQFGK